MSENNIFDESYTLYKNISNEYERKYDKKNR